MNNIHHNPTLIQKSEIVSTRIMLFMKSDLAYFIGVIQTDGCFRLFNFKRRKIWRLSLDVSEKSLSMLHKSLEIFNKRFNKMVSPYKRKGGTNPYGFQTSVNMLLPEFKKLDIKFSQGLRPPNWLFKDIKFFGSYLAGIIDGDGDIRIKRPEYPQCEIRVTCGSKPIILERSIEKIFSCSVGLVKVTQKFPLKGSNKKYTTVHRLFFNVSSKNNEALKKFVLPYLTIHHKKERLNLILKYLDKKISKHQLFNLYKKTLLRRMPGWQNSMNTVRMKRLCDRSQKRVEAAELVC